MKANDYAQGIYVINEPLPGIDFRKNSEARILRAFRITKREVLEADRPKLFRHLMAGEAFAAKVGQDFFVAVKLNSKNAAGGNNCAVIGGRFHVKGKPYDFSEGSVVVGVANDVICFPIKEHTFFGERERRAIRHA